ncbi:MAG TPA: hypothetical protein VGD88_06825 [Opitutaceae bacterium]
MELLAASGSAAGNWHRTAPRFRAPAPSFPNNYVDEQPWLSVAALPVKSVFETENPLTFKG